MRGGVHTSRYLLQATIVLEISRLIDSSCLLEQGPPCFAIYIMKLIRMRYQLSE